MRDPPESGVNTESLGVAVSVPVLYSTDGEANWAGMVMAGTAARSNLHSIGHVLHLQEPAPVCFVLSQSAPLPAYPLAVSHDTMPGRAQKPAFETEREVSDRASYLSAAFSTEKNRLTLTGLHRIACIHHRLPLIILIKRHDLQPPCLEAVECSSTAVVIVQSWLEVVASAGLCVCGEVGLMTGSYEMGWGNPA